MGVENERGIGEIGRARASLRALEVLADIRAAARQYADENERAALAEWSGWGPMSKAFAEASTSESWASIAERVNELLPAADVRLGMRGTYNAFFTPRAVTEAMWALLRELGFTGGAVAELGCGSGAFMATAPEEALVTGVERDPTTAAIASLLHPCHQVINAPLQHTHLPSNFGAVIGNIPFGDVKVFDPAAEAKSPITRSIHNYFLWRAVKALAPGGYAVVLTSRHTLDAIDPDAREQIATLADFVGALRLPSGGLEGGTEAVADIVVLRRKTDSPIHPMHDWLPVDRSRFGYANPVSGYWRTRPDHVLGTMVEGTTSRHGLGVLVKPIEGRTPAWGIRRAIPGLVLDANRMGAVWVPPVSVGDLDTAAVITAEGWLEGSFHLRSGQVLVVHDGVASPVPRPSGELVSLVGIKELAGRLLEMEADHRLADNELDGPRSDLRVAYERHVRRFGFLNRCKFVRDGTDEDGNPLYARRNPPMGGFRHDPGSALVFALEVYDHDNHTGRGAPLLYERQNRPVALPTRTAEPAEALAWCLDRKGGKVDLEYIAELLGHPARALCGTCGTDATRRDDGWEHLVAPAADHRVVVTFDDRLADSVAEQLGEAVFQEPEYRTWLTAEEYLSGDVREKHKVAKTAAIVDQRYQRNADALEKVLPRWLGPGEIIASLGTPWIPVRDVAQFIEELLESPPEEVKRLRSSNRWEVKGGLRVSTKASEEWGTPEIDAYELIELALNGHAPEVRRRVTKTRTEKDEAKTLQAADAQARIKKRFSIWVWEDSQRCERLVGYYNTHHNCLRPRQYDGTHITVPGLAKAWADKLYDHQREFIARVLASPATLCGHPVGAGKTATMTCAAMKLRSVGLVNKPMLVVPNHLLEQADVAARQMFPGAKIVSANAKTIAKNRRAFTAMVATQPWDLVIITQSAFDRMPIHPDTERAYLEWQCESLHTSIVEASPSGKLEGRMVKNMAKRLDRLEADIRSLQKRAHAPDGGVTFEQLGVTWIGVDEAHAYKNLAVPCHNDGFTINPSKRATHLDMVLRWMARQGSGRYAALFTGTPVSNTMLELFVMMQYTMPGYLDSIGLGSADAWVAAYVEMVTKVGVNLNGSDFEIQTRPARFINAPELRVLFSLVADIRTADELGLKRPAADERIIKVEPTSAQQDYSTLLVKRAKALKGVRFPEKGADNMLRVCNDGRWMATDPALVGITDSGHGKLHTAAERIFAEWQAAPTELQIGFCDIGTPSAKKGDQTYGRLRDLLVEMGMPASRIKFVQDAKTDDEKGRLFAACRDGRVSLIVGSTGALGTGTNIQDRVVAMHHIDAPYTPAGVEQRDGRGLRPGNRHSTVRVYRYVTARTFDAYLWQMLVRKLTFISQLMSGSLDRSIEDCATEQLMSFTAVEASATDQPLLMERVDVEAEVTRLRNLETGHRQRIARQKASIPRLREAIAEREAEQRSWQAIASAKLPEIDDALAEHLHAAMRSHSRYCPPKVRIGGLTVSFGDWYTSTDRERHPQMIVDASGGPQTENLYRSFKPATVVDRLFKLLAKAEAGARVLVDIVADLYTELADKQRLAAQPFEEAAELATVLARLDQIDAELRRAATKSENGEGTYILDGVDAIVGDDGAVIDVDGVMIPETSTVPPPTSESVDAGFDAGEMRDVLGALLSSHEERLAREMADAMAILGMS